MVGLKLSNEIRVSVYENMKEEDVIERAKTGGDMEALDYILGKYKNFVRLKSQSYF